MTKTVALVGPVIAASAALVTVGCAPGGMMGGCGGMMGSHGQSPKTVRVTCPVCATQLVVIDDTPRATYGGTLYYFVSEDHERQFLAAPEKYLLAGKSPDSPSPGAGDHRH